MDPILTLTADDNGTGQSIKVSAAFAEFWMGEKDTIQNQFSDVMAFDNGDGDPITGATIEFSYKAAEEWIKELQSILNDLNKEH